MRAERMGLDIDPTDPISVQMEIAPAPDSGAFAIPTTAHLLTTGGDTRIVCDRVHGLNKYGCPPSPESSVLSYGSSTASTISPASFAAAESLRHRLLHAARIEAPSVTYARELTRIRQELAGLCGLSDLPDLDIILAASGTDLHLIATLLAGGADHSRLLAVMVEATETGSGVPAALAGRHFDTCASLHDVVTATATIAGGSAIEVARVAARAADGSPRAAALFDAEVEALVADAVAANQKVLLTLVDVSKTGLLAPSAACALALRGRFPETVEILVDACQFRLATPTLRAYLEHGFWVALTGSKFITGPAFSGALLVPRAAARQLRARSLPSALEAYSARADWPQGWALRSALADVANYGLLLRWEAALQELRVFRSLPDAAITAFLEDFAVAIGKRLATDPAFERLRVPELHRHPLVNFKSWDQIPTIFPFLLRCSASGGSSALLNCEETARVWKLLGTDLAGHPDFHFTAGARTIAARRCQLGQPVACGTRSDVPVSALRLCASARLIVDAVSPRGRGAAAVIADALSVLDKAALLASHQRHFAR